MSEYERFAKDDYTWRVTDTERAVHELSKRHEESGDGERFVRDTIRQLQHNDAHRRSQAIIERFTEIAYTSAIAEHIDHFTGTWVPTPGPGVPPLLNHPAFEEGFAVGSRMAYLATPHTDHHLLADKVQDFADKAGVSPREFAYTAAHVGNTTITQGIVHPEDPAFASLRGYRNPLHTFINRLRPTLYDDQLHRINFKIGAGLAQRAYLDYCWDNAQQYRSVVNPHSRA